jgi:mono/diheme cytochrome c family protein
MRANVVIAAAMLVVAVCVPAAPDAAEEPMRSATEQGAATKPPPDSGEAMFQSYCAACHGSKGEGDGPAAVALKTPPPNLRLLARQNNGTYPAAHVESVLRFGVAYPAHGSSEMPVWGTTFQALSGDKEVVTQRIADLNEYLRSLQLK